MTETPTKVFDASVELTAELFDAPITILTLEGSPYRWLVSEIEAPNLPDLLNRLATLSAQATQSDDVSVIENLADDSSLANHPLVAGEMGLRFFVGIPIHGAEEKPISTLAMMDTEPRTVSDRMQHLLLGLRDLLADEFALRRERAARKEAERQLLTIAEEERRRIGQHLHDTLAGHLVGAGMMARTIAERLERGTTVSSDKVYRLTELIQDAGEQVRQLSHALIPMDEMAGDLAAALQHLGDETKQRSDMPCSVHIDEPIPPLNDEVTTHLYRIAAEATTNAVKHADASEIQIRLSIEDGALKLVVQDDGAGIPEAGASSDGAGFRIMRYRSSVIGALLTIDSSEEEGTTVRCRLPLASAQQDPIERAMNKAVNGSASDSIPAPIANLERTFQDERVRLDGRYFEACRFEGCQLEYEGGAPPIITDCTLSASDVVLEGAAERTLEALRAMYSEFDADGQAMIKDLCSQVLSR